MSCDLIAELSFLAMLDRISHRLYNWWAQTRSRDHIRSVDGVYTGAVRYKLGAPTDKSLPGAADGLSFQIVYGYKVSK